MNNYTKLTTVTINIKYYKYNEYTNTWDNPIDITTCSGSQYKCSIDDIILESIKYENICTGIYKVEMTINNADGSYLDDHKFIIICKDGKRNIYEYSYSLDIRDFNIGDIVNHFKYEFLSEDDKAHNRYKYQIQSFARHTETGEHMVVYQALYFPFKVYVRPMNMFISEIDHEKYPNTKQVFRFYKANPAVPL